MEDSTITPPHPAPPAHASSREASSPGDVHDGLVEQLVDDHQRPFQARELEGKWASETSPLTWLRAATRQRASVQLRRHTGRLQVRSAHHQDPSGGPQPVGYTQPGRGDGCTHTTPPALHSLLFITCSYKHRALLRMAGTLNTKLA